MLQPQLRTFLKAHYRSKAVQIKSSSCDASTQTDGPNTNDFGVQVGTAYLELDRSFSSDSTESTCHETEDSDYDPAESSSSEGEDMCDELVRNKLPTQEKFVVYKEKLKELLEVCSNCKERCRLNFHVIGTMVKVERTCDFCHIPISSWYSQPYLWTSNIPAGNIELSAAILYSGNQFAKVARFLEAYGVPSVSRSTFDSHQRQYLMPVVTSTWGAHQEHMFQELREMGGNLILSGDGRSDSPGHCAKFGSYSALEMRLGKGN